MNQLCPKRTAKFSSLASRMVDLAERGASALHHARTDHDGVTVGWSVVERVGGGG